MACQESDYEQLNSDAFYKYFMNCVTTECYDGFFYSNAEYIKGINVVASSIFFEDIQCLSLEHILLIAQNHSMVEKKLKLKYKSKASQYVKLLKYLLEIFDRGCKEKCFSPLIELKVSKEQLNNSSKINSLNRKIATNTGPNVKQYSGDSIDYLSIAPNGDAFHDYFIDFLNSDSYELYFERLTKDIIIIESVCRDIFKQTIHCLNQNDIYRIRENCSVILEKVSVLYPTKVNQVKQSLDYIFKGLEFWQKHKDNQRTAELKMENYRKSFQYFCNEKYFDKLSKWEIYQRDNYISFIESYIENHFSIKVNLLSNEGPEIIQNLIKTKRLRNRLSKSNTANTNHLMVLLEVVLRAYEEWKRQFNSENG